MLERPRKYIHTVKRVNSFKTLSGSLVMTAPAGTNDQNIHPVIMRLLPTVSNFLYSPHATGHSPSAPFREALLQVVYKGDFGSSPAPGSRASLISTLSSTLPFSHGGVPLCSLSSLLSLEFFGVRRAVRSFFRLWL